MPKGIKVLVSGDYAAFNRPEYKVERLSYDVMTYSAARGILEAIYWHPGILYVIDRIHVLNPIKFTNIRRNEVMSKIKADAVYSVMNGSERALYLNTSADIQQRASAVLKDVRYLVEAHFELTDKKADGDTEEKFYAIMMRRLKKGQCYHQPYFGVREFPVKFTLFEGEAPTTAYDGERDLGFMLHDMDYTDKENITPIFRRVIMRSGIIDFNKNEVMV